MAKSTTVFTGTPFKKEKEKEKERKKRMNEGREEKGESN